MTEAYLYGAILTMAAVTYLPRVLPLVLVRHRIENNFIRSFLYYVPYAVLTTMTIPAIFQATSSTVSAVAGLAAAIWLGWRGRSLLIVALGAAAVVFACERILPFIQQLFPV
jgi:branched-subunit amino acid transport protein